MLDKQGLVLTLAMGAAILLATDARYLETILIFLLLAVGVTKYEHDIKRDLGIYEHERSWENVLSNGIVPVILALLSPGIGPMPYICAIAGVTADKFGSELGVLGKTAISLENFKVTKSGRSGAISIFGCLASLAGATLIGVSAVFIFNISPTKALFIGLIGFLGSFVDSILGIFEERGIGTKATTNLACSISSAIMGFYYFI